MRDREEAVQFKAIIVFVARFRSGWRTGFLRKSSAGRLDGLATGSAGLGSRLVAAKKGIGTHAG